MRLMQSILLATLTPSSVHIFVSAVPYIVL